MGYFSGALARSEGAGQSPCQDIVATLGEEGDETRREGEEMLKGVRRVERIGRSMYVYLWLHRSRRVAIR